jgi:hypothetical protein
MNECFADEIAIDFPSVGPVIDRMRDAFLGERVDADVLRAQVSLTQREASGGLVVTLEVPVRVTCPHCGRGKPGRAVYCADHRRIVDLPARASRCASPTARVSFRLRSPDASACRVEVRVAVRSSAT